MAKKKDTLVPCEKVSPGYEEIYLGEISDTPVRESQMVSVLYSDEEGNLISQWCTFPWIFPDEKGQWKEDAWDDAVKCLNKMQSNLRQLNDDIRLLRCHITSLIPCDSGLPVTIDELLFAIGRGKLEGSSFKNGCLCSGLGCSRLKTSQPGQPESLKVIHEVLNAYLAGKSKQDTVKIHSEAAGFIERAWQWLGSVSKLSNVQQKMLDRVLMIMDYFARCSVQMAIKPVQDTVDELKEIETLGNDLFSYEVSHENIIGGPGEPSGRGPRLDAEIAELAGLPEIHPKWEYAAYKEALDTLKDEQKQELYKTCCAIASGIHTLSDCHHSTFRYIEGWIHGIGTGRLGIPTRKAQSEKQRLGHMLFGYALGLDRWLARVPLQFLLLDLGHIDLGFDPRNNIIRVYACLGEEVTPEKEWLAACLWYNLVYNQQGGLISHTDLINQCKNKGVTVDGWIDSVFKNDSQKEIW